MALFSKPTPSRWPSWFRGGGLLVLVSLGLHGVLLALPTPDASPPAAPNLPPEDSPPAIDVVRLDGSRLPSAAPPASPARHAAAPSPARLGTQSAPPVNLSLAAVPPESEPTSPPPVPPPAPPESEPPPPITLAERLQTPEEYRFNNRLKSLTADTQSFLAWYGEQTWDPELELAPLPGSRALSPLQVPYPLSNCLIPPPNQVSMAVIISAGGTLMGEPELLDSTGYDVLDEEALEAVKQYDFSTAANPALPNPTVYWLPVEVVYDASGCQS